MDVCFSRPWVVECLALAAVYILDYEDLCHRAGPSILLEVVIVVAVSDKEILVMRMNGDRCYVRG
jgi:hypothetical protein